MNKNQPRDKELIQTAKRHALEVFNQNRAKAGLPPLKRVDRIWWMFHRETYIKRAQAAADRETVRA